MAGTSRAATAAMRRMPPSSTRPTATVMSSPGTQSGTSTPAIVRAASAKVRATVFDWAMLPVPNSAVQAPKNANTPASPAPSCRCGTARLM